MCQKLKFMIKTYCKDFILTSCTFMAWHEHVNRNKAGASPFIRFDACLVPTVEEFGQYLESSTIHGLAYISLSAKWVAKIFWLLVVIAGFTSAGYDLPVICHSRIGMRAR